MKRKGEKAPDQDDFDEDVDRTMYQEFWAELRDFKKPPGMDRKSRSAMRPKQGDQFGF